MKHLLLIACLFVISGESKATKIVNESYHKIEGKRSSRDGHVGYQITINGKPTLHEHYLNTMPGASKDLLLQVARTTPVIFGRPRFVRISTSQHCPGSKVREVLEALVQDGDEEYRLCFNDSPEYGDGEVYIATDLRD